ncbi:unnamed protein product [Musa acuminata subsp. burmannicoides]
MASRMEAQEAKELLEEERRRLGDWELGVVVAYKESEGFCRGLQRVERDSYRYEYLIALRRFQTQHPGWAVEEDPFAQRPKDMEVSWGRISFDDD